MTLSVTTGKLVTHATGRMGWIVSHFRTYKVITIKPGALIVIKG